MAIDRREFLKMAGLGVLGLAVAPLIKSLPDTKVKKTEVVPPQEDWDESVFTPSEVGLEDILTDKVIASEGWKETDTGESLFSNDAVTLVHQLPPHCYPGDTLTINYTCTFTA